LLVGGGLVVPGDPYHWRGRNTEHETIRSDHMYIYNLNVNANAHEM
jgi:hypothetical protein